MTNSPGTTANGGRSAPITERRFMVPFILITSLFFLWAFGVNLNDILIPHLKKAFGLTDFQSSFIQVAFFGGYFLAAFPAGWLMEKIGYKKGILAGLFLCAAGAVLFLPASSSRVYGFFLFALFVMACGQSFLEVAANPYVTTLGPAESSERRLNLAQSFNAMGAVVTPFIGAAFILSALEYSREQLTTMTPAEMATYRTAVVSTVRMPYLVIAGLFLAYAAVIFLSQLPEVGAADGAMKQESTGEELRDILRYGHLVKGVIAQFFYVGAQIGVGSFVIRLAQHSIPGMLQKDASFYLKLHLIGFMLGRFSGSYIMKRVPAARLLSLFALSTLIGLLVVLLGSGVAPLWAVVLIGFFHSIMFPTIFALSIKQLGRYTKLGSSLLVASILGGAICPAIMGFISDHSNIRVAFIVPLICQAYVLYFAVRGYRPVLVEGSRAAELSTVK